MILITFCSVSDKFYQEANVNDKYHTVIDLFNRAHTDKINITLKNRKDFQEIASWVSAARSNYLKFLAELSVVKLSSKTNIRDFKMFGVPVYWLTAMSEKHPRNHWLFSFFLFLEFLKSNYYKDEELVIYLNQQTVELKEHILELNLENHHRKKISFYIPDERSEFHNVKEVIKRQIVSFFYMSRYSSFKEDLKEEQIQVITQDCNRVFFRQFQNADFFKEHHVSLNPLNYFSLKQENYNHISSAFFNYTPGIRKKIEIFLVSLILLIRISFFKNKIRINNKIYPSTLIKDEFYDVLKNAQVYFSIYHTYKDFFKGVKKKTLFFLQDEFYRHGRIISKAYKDTKNKNVKLFGMQHGMFSESHTVYTILNKEVTDIHAGDGIPLPDKFIVWGEYFKNVFHKNNQLNTDFTEVLGCPHYIRLKSHYKTLKQESKNLNYILWCTTGVEQFLFELPFVLKLMEIHSLPLVVRNHPLGHISKELIEKRLKGITYTFDSEKEIYISISNSAFVICSAHSTVVLDCLVCEKKVYRIIFDRSDEEFTEPSEYIVNVKNLKELENIHAYNGLNNSINKYLYLEEDRWVNFLNRNIKE